MPAQSVLDESKKPRGFAAMSDQKRRELAQRGGQAAHKLKRAHQWTPDEASEAGKRSGASKRRKDAA